MKSAFLLFLILLSFTLVSCALSTSDITSLADLNSNPYSYKGGTVTVKGNVIESFGEFTELLFIPDGSFTTLSPVIVAEYLLEDDGQRIIIAQTTGGSDLQNGKLTITGIWVEKEDGSFVLYVAP